MGVKYEYVLFDLDGTLTDPALGITNSVMYALRHFGIEVQDRRELYFFIGPPLKETFEKRFGFTPDEGEEALAQYRVYFSDKGLFENSVYDGIPELLKTLTEHGTKVVLATSKPTVYADRILEHFGLKQYFTFLSGSELNGDRVEKADVIRYALDHLPITDKDRLMMVGDRSFDVDGARECGLPCIGVLYGYGDETELKDASAIAKTVSDLKALLL